MSLKKISIYSFCLLWLCVNIYPLLFTLISSFKNNDEIYNKMFLLPDVYRFENYISAFNGANISTALLNSIFVSSASTVLLLIIATCAAFVLARFRFKFTAYLELFFIAGILIPIYSLLVPISKVVYNMNGLDNYFMLIAVYIALNLSICIFLITGFMKGIDASLEEAVVMDGGGSFTILTKVIIPLCMPALATAGIISFLNIYNELFFAVVLLTDQSKYTIPVALLSFKGMYSQDLGITFAAVIMSIFPMLIVYLLFQEKVESGLSAGAVKG